MVISWIFYHLLIMVICYFFLSFTDHVSYECYDSKADLWSFGVILYEMMTGRTPFRASNHIALLKRIQATSFIFFPDEKQRSRRFSVGTSAVPTPLSSPRSLQIQHPWSANTSVAFQNQEAIDIPSGPAYTYNHIPESFPDRLAKGMVMSRGTDHDLRELTRLLLKKNPKQRIAPKEFFQHPALQFNSTSSCTVDKNVHGKADMFKGVRQRPMTIHVDAVKWNQFPSSASPLGHPSSATTQASSSTTMSFPPRALMTSNAWSVSPSQTPIEEPVAPLMNSPLESRDRANSNPIPIRRQPVLPRSIVNYPASGTERTLSRESSSQTPKTVEDGFPFAMEDDLMDNNQMSRHNSIETVDKSTNQLSFSNCRPSSRDSIDRHHSSPIIILPSSTPLAPSPTFLRRPSTLASSPSNIRRTESTSSSAIRPSSPVSHTPSHPSPAQHTSIQRVSSIRASDKDNEGIPSARSRRRHPSLSSTPTTLMTFEDETFLLHPSSLPFAITRCDTGSSPHHHHQLQQQQQERVRSATLPFVGGSLESWTGGMSTVVEQWVRGRVASVVSSGVSAVLDPLWPQVKDGNGEKSENRDLEDDGFVVV
jgi:hypothetical protein